MTERGSRREEPRHQPSCRASANRKVRSCCSPVYPSMHFFYGSVLFSMLPYNMQNVELFDVYFHASSNVRICIIHPAVVDTFFL